MSDYELVSITLEKIEQGGSWSGTFSFDGFCYVDGKRIDPDDYVTGEAGKEALSCDLWQLTIDPVGVGLLSYEIEYVGVADTWQDYADELYLESKKRLDAMDPKQWRAGRRVDWTAVFEIFPTHQDYYGEWDDPSWEYRGELDMKSIKVLA